MKTPNHRRDRSILKEPRNLHARGALLPDWRLPASLRAILLCWLLLAPGACLLSKPKPTSEPRIKFVTGSAAVISFDKDMRYSVLDTQHGRKPAWWDNNTEIFRDNQIMSAWNARPGDKIQISGFETNGEILLRKVWVK